MLPWKDANPSGALLIFEDRPETFVIQNSHFWNLPAPALVVSNSSLTISNSSFDQNLRWGPRVAVVKQGGSLYVSGTTFTNADCARDGALLILSTPMHTCGKMATRKEEIRLKYCYGLANFISVMC